MASRSDSFTILIVGSSDVLAGDSLFFPATVEAWPSSSMASTFMELEGLCSLRR